MAEPSRGYLILWAIMLVLWLLMPVAFYVNTASNGGIFWCQRWEFSPQFSE